MRFQAYINEYGSYDYTNIRSQGMNIEKALPLIKENCKKIYSYYQDDNNPKIYRGNYSLGMAAAIVDPTAVERVSRNTSNYYTLLLSNLPSWKDYPPRSRSIVCANYFGRAQAYGGPTNTFLVLPYDGCKIGIVPEVDIFIVTIPKLLRMRFEEFNANLSMLMQKTLGTAMKYDTDWNTLEYHLKKIKRKDIEKFKDSSIIAMMFFESEAKNLYEFLNTILDPKVLRFKVVKPGQELPGGTGPSMMESNEIWVGNGPSILVNAYYLEDIGLKSPVRPEGFQPEEPEHAKSIHP